MFENESFTIPDSVRETPQSEISLMLEEDVHAVAYQGLRQQFIESALPAKSPKPQRRQRSARQRQN